jgi:pilus assembly protein CpaC
MEVKKYFGTESNRKNGWGRGVRLSLAAILALTTLPSLAKADEGVAAATTPDVSTTAPGDGFEKIALGVQEAHKLSLGHKVSTVKILNPDVADVLPLGLTDLLVTGKKAGTTQLIVWDDTDHPQIFDVEVQNDIAMLRKKIGEIFPGSKIQVEETGSTITLRGQVKDLMTAAQATQLASSYGKVLNFLEIAGGQQVMLQVRFAEVSKQAEQQLSFNFGGTDGTSFFGTGNTGTMPFGLTGQTIPTTLANAGAIATSTAVFGQGQAGKIAFQYFINALETDSVLRLLAEPDLVTTSGQEATFLAGGSFPYPVPQSGAGGSSTITIQFQDYGVTLKFTPIVLGNGRIRLHCAPEVSELDYSHSVSIGGTPVPGLTKRNIDTTVEMSEGQTLALGGLLQDNVTASNSELPLLGDLPVLGALFRSVQYQDNKTELVVLVTPVLVQGMNPADVTPVPGGKWRDPTEAQLFLNKDLGSEMQPGTSTKGGKTVAAVTPTQNPPLFQGAYGFRPAGTPVAAADAQETK